MRLCAALLLCAIAVAGQGQESLPIPLKDPFDSFNASAVEEIRVSGKVLATIKSGDYVHPTFSPDGKFLAYSRVIVRRDIENTEVLIHSLSTGKRSVLLNSRRAWRYATYKAYVSEMTWTSPRRLGVVIGDGDVDSTELTFDPFTRRLLRERHESLDEFDPQRLSMWYKQARQQAVTLFPEFPRDVLDNALTSSALVLPDEGIVLQNDDVLFLDFKGKSIKPLINLSKDDAQAFHGGLSFGSSIIIVLSHGSKTYLLLYRDGKIKPLSEINSPGYSRVEIKHRSPEGVVFLVRTHESYERGDNPLFIFNGERLLQIKEYPELHDAAVDTRGQRIAFSYWQGDQRHVVIKELN
jgi:hypothetical protein